MGAFKSGFMGCFGFLAAGFVVLIVLVVIAAIALDNADDKTRAGITGNAGDVVVSVTGNAGPFSGNVGALATQRSVEGVTPQDFTVEGQGSSGVFTAVMQKKAEGGTLTVTLKGCPDGKEKTQSTSAAYGVVTVTC